MGYKILVSGATGHHGATGAHTVQRLREHGHEVRVLARSRGPRSDALSALGAEIVVGDLRDQRTLEPALAGVDAATFTYPVGEGIAHAAASFAAAMRAAAPRARLVVMSMVPAQPNSPSPLGRAQWLADELFGWAGVSPCVLRVAAFFYENIPLLHGDEIRDTGTMTNAFGDVALPWIAGRDAGELMVQALLHPERFPAGIHYPTGAALRSHAELAEELSALLGRAVVHHTIARDAWRTNLVAHGHAAALADHITALAVHLTATGAPARPADPAALTALLGRPPTSFAAFVDQALSGHARSA